MANEHDDDEATLFDPRKYELTSALTLTISPSIKIGMQMFLILHGLSVKGGGEIINV